METKCHNHRLHMQRTKRLRKSQSRIQPDESESSEKDLASARQSSRTTFESDAWHTMKIQLEKSIPVIAEINMCQNLWGHGRIIWVEYGPWGML